MTTLLMERVTGDGAPLEVLGEIPCPTSTCNGTGQRVRLFDRVLEVSCADCQEDAEREIAERERREQADALIARAGGTPRMAAFTLNSYFTDDAGKAALRAVLEWRDAVQERVVGAPNLYLHGEIGTGKTGLMWPVVRQLCEKLIPAKLVDFPSLLQEMRDAYSHHIPFDEFADYGRVSVLVLDDVGGEKPTEWTASQLLHLVNQRYERRLPTAFVSNYAPSRLIERLDVGDDVVARRIVSRMTEHVIRHFIDAEDRR
jgi:DNA replication protein DnaC